MVRSDGTQRRLNGGGRYNTRWMTLSDPALSPHYIIANCFLPQRADAVNGYKSRYITGQSSINNAPLVTNARITERTQGSQIFQLLPPSFRVSCWWNLQRTCCRSFTAPGDCQSPNIVSLRPSWQCVFSASSAAAGGCRCILQELTPAPPLVGETQRPPACVSSAACVW